MNSTAAARPGRNEPCHCGSGKKYKQCCLAKDEAEARQARAEAADQEPVPTQEAPVVPERTRKHETQQPWKKASTHGFQHRVRTPRKVGGS
jgi:hypothetical protein